MQISVECPRCGRQYFLDENLRGQNVACPNPLCRDVFQVPADARAIPEAPLLESSDIGLVPIEEENKPVYQGPKGGKPKGSGPVGDMVEILPGEPAGGKRGSRSDNGPDAGRPSFNVEDLVPLLPAEAARAAETERRREARA